MRETSPIVTCPGCDVEMAVDTVEPSKDAQRMDEVTYACPQCGMRTTRRYASPPDGKAAYRDTSY
jgi:ribosomal protein L37AE/L43A